MVSVWLLNIVILRDRCGQGILPASSINTVFVAAKPSATAATPKRCPLRGIQDGEKQDPDPRWPRYQRNNFHEPRLLHLSIHRK